MPMCTNVLGTVWVKAGVTTPNVKLLMWRQVRDTWIKLGKGTIRHMSSKIR